MDIKNFEAGKYGNKMEIFTKKSFDEIKAYILSLIQHSCIKCELHLFKFKLYNWNDEIYRMKNIFVIDLYYDESEIDLSQILEYLGTEIGYVHRSCNPDVQKGLYEEGSDVIKIDTDCFEKFALVGDKFEF